MMRPLFSTAVVLLSLCLAREDLAAGGTLETPSISVATASGRNGAEWVTVLADKRFKFIVGDFVNATTNLYYAGDTESLNSFLSNLVTVEGTVIHVSFSKESKDAASDFGSDEKHSGPCQWQIQHLGREPEVFYVTVFLGDGKIDITKLNLPLIRSAKTRSTDVKRADPKPTASATDAQKP